MMELRNYIAKPRMSIKTLLVHLLHFCACALRNYANNWEKREP